ncbi:MAG: histidine--tRNA ligase [bacterium]
MIERPRGTNDFIPPESSLREKIINLISDYLKAFGYELIETPIFEKVELFKRSVGVGSDIVLKEMYEFKDKKGRDLVLRPELTASVVRAVIQNKLYNNNYLKFYYIGPIFRYEKPQLGRFRQATQFGIEYLGNPHFIADFEIIFLTQNLYNYIFNKFNIKNIEFKIHINSIGCNDCRPNYKNKLYEYFIKYKDDLCSDCQKRLELNVLRILDCKNPVCKKISSDAPKSIDFLCLNCKNHFNNLLNLLKANNINFVLDNNLVRGLDYYNRTVFEVKIILDNNIIDLAGGGRYDYLANFIDSSYNIAGCGFAGGLERLILIINNYKTSLKKIKILFALIVSEENLNTFKYLLNIFENVNNNIDNLKDYSFYFSIENSLKSALKKANNMNADYILFIGNQEIEKNIFQIKDLKTGKQKVFSLNEINLIIKNIGNLLDNFN